ncbi:MAG: class I SAM-dependent methyltransferase [Thermaurantimonas sp.]|uniref:class I SAM-dependent methyltransferase n=1 Tax=Thermaurantimonas sp. TaxID=2681568 RepID=UPI00391CFAA9
MNESILCPICKRNNVKNLRKTLRNNYFLVNCLECDFYFASPRPTFQELSDFYNSISSIRFFKHSQKEAEKFSEPLFKKIRTYHPSCRKILEIGASTGYQLFGLKNRGYEVVGSELSNDACKLAREWYNIEMYADEFPPEEEFKEYFDVIIIHHVIEHVVKPREFIERASKYLAKNGWLFIETPNVKSLGVKLLGKDYPVFCPPGHLNFFSKKTLESILPKSIIPIKSYTTSMDGLTPYNILNGIFSKLKLKDFIDKKINVKQKIEAKSEVKVLNSKKYIVLTLLFRLSKFVFILFYPLFIFIDSIGLGENLYLISKKK